MKNKNNGKRKIKSIRDPREKGELVKDILVGLAKGGVILSSFAVPNIASVLKLFDADNSRERYRINRIIKKLEEERMIEIYEKEGEERVEITEKGKRRVRKFQIDELKLKRPKKWDGKWRIIIFDIPERFKRGRDALTRKIRDMEILKLQKSVYVCPFECRDEIDFVGETFGVRKFINYIIASDVGEAEGLKLKMFYNL